MVEPPDDSVTQGAEAEALPPAIEGALSGPALERKGWQTTTAPTYIGLFLWVVFFDQLGRRTLSIGGLVPSVMGAGAGGLLCYLLLYYPLAMWGHKTGRPLMVLATSTFGARGSVWLTGVLVGLAQIVWLAVATDYATDWTFQGLVSSGLLNARALRPVLLGGIQLRSPLFLITSLAWIYAAALVGRYLVRIIAALMNIYPLFPAVMLGLAMVLTIKGLPAFRPLEIDPATSRPVVDGGARAFLLMIQLIFGFFASAGLESPDWGAVNRSPSDVRAGGLVGVAFASWIVATLGLLTVAGALGSLPPPPGLRNAPGVGNFSFRVALLLGINERLAGGMFLVFGLASLAPTCYASFVLGNRLSGAWPRLSSLRWTLLGTALGWCLVASGLAIRLEEIFSLMGAVFGPLAGALAGDFVRSRGAWRGPRRGVSAAGLVAWVAGLSVGFVPILAGSWNRPDWQRFQPAAVYAFLASFVVYSILARIGAESPVESLPAAGTSEEGVPVPETVAETGSG